MTHLQLQLFLPKIKTVQLKFNYAVLSKFPPALGVRTRPLAWLEWKGEVACGQLTQLQEFATHQVSSQ